ncbi:MAG: shikimate dehydrogenase [Verrucomicrobia bacterium]|nr:shikimate dehydrogenase [Verrucomicrobiota bacterium]
MNLSGHTKPYAVLGHPIGHTLSPVMHNASLRSLGLDAIYLAFDVQPDRLLEVLAAMRAMGFGGVNLTVPLKEVAFRGLTNLATSARRLGAVNTVEFCADGSLKGHNTDGGGFLTAVEEAFGASVRGKRLFVLGCGGAGRAVALTAAAEGALELAIADLESERVQRLAAELAKEFPHCAVIPVPAGTSAWAAASRHAELVVQSTPVGMKPTDAALLGADAFRPGQWVFDLVYMYPETAFMQSAVAAGAQASNGLGMLLHQGARAFRLWTGQDADVAAMRQALEQAVYHGKH